MRNSVTLIILSLALFVLPDTSVRADDPATQPALVQFGFFGGKSLDTLKEFTRNTGFVLGFNGNVFWNDLEQQYPFVYTLRTEWVDRDKPVGIAFVGRPDSNAKPSQMMVFVLPIRKDVNMRGRLMARGAIEVPDQPDTVWLDGIAIRHTTNHILCSANTAALSAVNIDAIIDAVRNDDAVARLSIDVKWVRHNMPNAYERMTATAAHASGAAWLVTRMLTIDSLDRFDASLDNGKNGFRFAVTAAPVILPPPARIKRPGMPLDVMYRLDWGVPLNDAFPSAKALLASIDPTDGLAEWEPVTIEGKKEKASFIERLAALERDPTATSVGVKNVRGIAVTFVRQHLSRQVDVRNEIRQLAASFNAIHKEVGSGKSVELQTYPSKDDQVLRTVLKENGKPTGYLDVLQKGPEVYMTLSSNEWHCVPELVAAADEGPISSTFSGYLDLGKLATHYDDIAGPDVPKGVRQMMVQVLANEKITVTTSSAGDAVTFELSGSRDLIQKIGALAFAMFFDH